MPQPDPAPLPLADPRPKGLRPFRLPEEGLPRGLDFTVPDPLGLAQHPALRAAAAKVQAAPFSPGPACAALDARLARFCHLPAALTFASGGEAVHATLGALLGPGDEVIVDAGLPPAYAAAVHAARARLHLCPPASVEAVERRLLRLPRQARRFVCVPALSDLASLTADLGDLVALAVAQGATLIVDVSQDLGTLGLSGRGLAEVQGCLGQIDVLVGGVSGSFGVAAGIAAVRDPSLLARLRPARSPATLAPILAGALLAALELVDSDEGRRRRRRLHGNSLRLRNHLMAEGLRLLGQPGPCVPIPLPPGQAERMTALLASTGPRVPLITAPFVGRHHPRWLVRLSSDHSPADIDNLAEVIVDVTRALRLRA
jgi:glycine C-acetyltransferase